MSSGVRPRHLETLGAVLRDMRAGGEGEDQEQRGGEVQRAH